MVRPECRVGHSLAEIKNISRIQITDVRTSSKSRRIIDRGNRTVLGTCRLNGEKQRTFSLPTGLLFEYSVFVVYAVFVRKNNAIRSCKVKSVANYCNVVCRADERVEFTEKIQFRKTTLFKKFRKKSDITHFIG